MIAKFKSRTSGMADALTDQQIDPYLNLYYQEIIPAEVDGPISEAVWSFTVTQGQTEVVIPDWVVSLNKASFWFETSANDLESLDVFRDFQRFEQYYPGRILGAQARPKAVLIYADKVYLHAPADGTYTIKCQCRGGSPTGIDQTTGITKELFANAVVAGAAFEYLTEQEDLEGASREFEHYTRFLDLMRHRYKAYYEPRRPKRSF